MVHGLEDSADLHARDWLDGPLFECLNASMWRFFRTDPKGRATLDFMTDAAFAPGGPFEHVTLTLQRIQTAPSNTSRRPNAPKFRPVPFCIEVTMNQLIKLVAWLPR